MAQQAEALAKSDGELSLKPRIHVEEKTDSHNRSDVHKLSQNK